MGPSPLKRKKWAERYESLRHYNLCLWGPESQALHAEVNMGNTTANVLAQTMNCVAMIINGAPYIEKEEDREGKANHRHNTPWAIHFPSQGITFQVLDDAGRPITGYYSDRQAESDAHSLWEYLRGLTEDQRRELRDQSEFPMLYDGFKIMNRVLRVRPIK